MRPPLTPVPEECFDAASISASASVSVSSGEPSVSSGSATNAEVWNSAFSTSPAAIDFHNSARARSSASSGPPPGPALAALERAAAPALFAE